MRGHGKAFDKDRRTGSSQQCSAHDDGLRHAVLVVWSKESIHNWMRVALLESHHRQPDVLENEIDESELGQGLIHSSALLLTTLYVRPRESYLVCWQTQELELLLHTLCYTHSMHFWGSIVSWLQFVAGWYGWLTFSSGTTFYYKRTYSS